MLLSSKWLSDYVEIDPKALGPRPFSEAMTMSGSKVEGWRSPGDEIENVVAGRVLSVEKHPHADKLVVCRVDAGGPEPLQIVTGAKNVVPGALVPVALDGSSLPGGVRIARGELRGVESNGMLCSLSELGLTKNDFPYAIEDGIFLMEEECAPGDDIRKVLGLDDLIVEFEITPNRPDCLSVLGLAREAAVTFRRPLKMPDGAVRGSSGSTRDYVSVAVHDAALCPRYAARAVKNVKIAPSPRWMRERLRAAGVRPINNIVDITNFVMLEYGQPMHAFDYRTLRGGEIHVRRAGEGETIVTLDGAERKLTEKMLVIADKEGPVAVAGVMGGENSGIRDDTSAIVFESAVFDATSVRLTSKKLGLRSEASSRFEKGLDPQNALPALNRACRLVELLGAGEVCGDAIDEYPSPKELRTVRLEPDWINGFLGTEIPAAFMEDALRRLEFKVEDGLITVPSFRGDVEHKADIAEEVARIWGYDKIPCTLVRGQTTRGGLTPAQKFEKKASSALLALGFSEISTYSFISPSFYDKIRLPADSSLRVSVKIRNPLGEDTSVMRTTALPSLLDILSRNYNNRNLTASLYELATVYRPCRTEGLPDENQQLVLGMYGAGADFFALKGAVEGLFAECRVSGVSFEACKTRPEFHPGRCARALVNGKELAVLGELHPGVLENYQFGTRVCAAAVDFDLLYENAGALAQYKPLPRFPAVTRDIAVTCGEDTPAAALEGAIRGAADHLETLTLFDVYRGSQLPEGKKSVAFSLTLRAEDRTLTDAEAEAVMANIVKAVEKLGASLRA